MRKLFVFLIFISVLSCQEENQPPTCKLLSPLDISTFLKGDSITISAEARDPDGLISEIKLYIDDIGIASLQNFPYNYEIYTIGYDTGNHIIKAVAIDDDGGEATDEVQIIIFNSVMDYDGNTYGVIRIGSQIWMKENLKVTHYTDGSTIPLVEDESAWHNLDLNSSVYCWYDNNPANRDIYGALYTWAAAMNGAGSSDTNPSGIQGVCPTGWHLPSDDEWKELEMYLGMSQEDANEFNGYRGNDEGGKLKETGITHWLSPNTGATNESGFTALPGGYRGMPGTFSYITKSCYFWTSTKVGAFDYAYFRTIYFDRAWIQRPVVPTSHGFSVRCLKD